MLSHSYHFDILQCKGGDTVPRMLVVRLRNPYGNTKEKALLPGYLNTEHQHLSRVETKEKMLLLCTANIKCLYLILLCITTVLEGKPQDF
jgi:hypothetical protein